MTDDPKSIKTMRAYYADRLAIPNEDELMAEMVESNDRSAIITIAALLDDAALWAVATRLPGLATATKEQFDQAFRHDGPFGTFSARIEAGFLLGGFDETTRSQLDTIRAMRNSVAHTGRRVTFADHQLANATKRLFHPTGSFKLLNETPEGFRRTLVVEGMLIYNTILHGRDAAKEAVRGSFLAEGRDLPF